VTGAIAPRGGRSPRRRERGGCLGRKASEPDDDGVRGRSPRGVAVMDAPRAGEGIRLGNLVTCAVGPRNARSPFTPLPITYSPERTSWSRAMAANSSVMEAIDPGNTRKADCG